MNQEIINQAVIEYLNRQARTRHPKGKFDNGGRWYPSDTETCKCCSAVRSPSRNWPFSYMTHCRTAEHVANLYQVDAKLVKRAARDIRKELESA